ncbi:elongation of very long chain fatty acids protein F [Drosophila mojavensis]|uniref:Elongation of very long chain fatty acids protein n=1 Tax=Drosophila mojavensis TaxID=7230 RepID=B4KCN5_DROMO|nr:elongation of very long chain fatty acids protein F [Drosophila mojavensis]EDW15884.1 uncharacterized protein Dmoj_GI10223 [Drosophila mojavensis]
MLEIFDTAHVDPSGLFLATSPWPMVAIVSSYLIFVLKGRTFMEKRKAYDLRSVLKVYNLIQILYNASLFVTVVSYLIGYKNYNLSCMRIVPLNHPDKKLDRMICYAYYVNKYIDLLDTVFIVLRKNNKQITILHLVHHLYMPITGYFIIRFIGFGGHLLVMGVLNVFVHVIMYSYYYAAAQSSTKNKLIWWKQYITILQMLQFVIICGHSVWTLMQPKCDASRPLIYMTFSMSIVMFSMFTNFYIHAYILPKNRKPVKSD